MCDKDKKELEQELSLEELEQVSGGGLRDVYVTPTKDIDKGIEERI